MIDLDDDRRADLLGIAVVLLLVFAVVTVVLAATSPQQESAAPPDADWELERSNDTHVRITHAGGEPVSTERLDVTVDGIFRHTRWSAATLTDGEYGVVRAGDGVKLTLLWTQSEAEREVLRQWSLSGSPTRSPTELG